MMRNAQNYIKRKHNSNKGLDYYNYGDENLIKYQKGHLTAAYIALDLGIKKFCVFYFSLSFIIF